MRQQPGRLIQDIDQEVELIREHLDQVQQRKRIVVDKVIAHKRIQYPRQSETDYAAHESGTRAVVGVDVFAFRHKGVIVDLIVGVFVEYAREVYDLNVGGIRTLGNSAKIRRRITSVHGDLTVSAVVEQQIIDHREQRIDRGGRYPRLDIHYRVGVVFNTLFEARDVIGPRYEYGFAVGVHVLRVGIVASDKSRQLSQSRVSERAHDLSAYSAYRVGYRVDYRADRLSGSLTYRRVQHAFAHARHVRIIRQRYAVLGITRVVIVLRAGTGGVVNIRSQPDPDTLQQRIGAVFGSRRYPVGFLSCCQIKRSDIREIGSFRQRRGRQEIDVFVNRRTHLYGIGVSERQHA